MNTKQVKQSASSAVSKPASRPASSQPLTDTTSHFQWPVSSQTTSFQSPAGLNTTHSAAASVSQSAVQSSVYSQPVSSMLPPINALAQASRLPTQQIPSSSAFLNNPSLTNYPAASGGATTNPLVNFPYPQFPMFGMTGSLHDMASLNQSAISGLANLQYYRPDSSGQGSNNTTGM